jgi:protease secretion system outer membrane protein
VAVKLPVKRRKLVQRMAGAIAAACLLQCGQAQAIGLLAAYEAALKVDPTFRAAFYEGEVGKEYRNIGRSGLLPAISANYSASNNRTDQETSAKDFLGRPIAPSQPHYTSRNATISLRQPLVSFEAAARYRQGVAQSEQSLAQVSYHSQDLVLRLTAAYFDVLFAGEQLALAQASRDMYLEQKKVNDRMFEKGEGTKTDMVETQARLDLAEAQLLESTDNEANARIALSAIIGEEFTSIDPLAAGFTVQPTAQADFDNWKQQALAKNPEILIQTKAVEMAAEELKRSKAGHMPRLDLVASYGKSSSETINTLNQDTLNRSVGFQLSVPIYSGGYVNATTRQGVAALERAKASLKATTDKVMLELRRQFNAVASGATRVTALVKAVESSKLLVKATEQSIKGGVRINLDLLNAQQQLHTGQRDLAQARYNYLQATMRLRAAAGSLDYGDVRDVAANFH